MSLLHIDHMLRLKIPSFLNRGAISRKVSSIPVFNRTFTRGNYTRNYTPFAPNIICGSKSWLDKLLIAGIFVEFNDEEKKPAAVECKEISIKIDKRVSDIIIFIVKIYLKILITCLLLLNISAGSILSSFFTLVIWTWVMEW